MTRDEFLERLGGLLACLPEDQAEESRQFCAEAIADRMEDGMTEEEAVAAMGTPGAVAESILDELPAVPRALARARRHSSALFWILVIAGSPLWASLLIALALTALSVYICIWVLALCAWVITASFAASGLVALALAGSGIAIGHMPYVLTMLGSGLALLGVSFFAGVGARAVSRQIARLSMLWLRKAISPFWKGSADVDGGPSDSPSERRAMRAQSDDAVRIVCLSAPGDEEGGAMTGSKKIYFAVAAGLVAVGVVLAALGWALSGFSASVFNAGIDLCEGHIVLGGVKVGAPTGLFPAE